MMSTESKTDDKTDRSNWVKIAILVVVFSTIGMFLFIAYLDINEYNNLVRKTTKIGEEGYLAVSYYFFLSKDSAKYFTIKVTSIDVQNSNDDKTIILHATFKNIKYDVVDINWYSYYLVTDEEHSYQSTALLTVDGTKVIKDTHKECVMKFNIPANEKPVKLIIMDGNRIVKEVVLRYS